MEKHMRKDEGHPWATHGPPMGLPWATHGPLVKHIQIEQRPPTRTHVFKSKLTSYPAGMAFAKVLGFTSGPWVAHGRPMGGP